MKPVGYRKLFIITVNIGKPPYVIVRICLVGIGMMVNAHLRNTIAYNMFIFV